MGRRAKTVQYTLAQASETIISVPGKEDSPETRSLAMAELEQLNPELAQAVTPDDLVPVAAQPDPTAAEGDLGRAIKTLNDLATLKLKVQELRSESLKVQAQIALLFSNEAVSEEDAAKQKEGFKILNAFAHANGQYRQAKADAEKALVVLDAVLQAQPHSV